MLRASRKCGYLPETCLFQGYRTVIAFVTFVVVAVASGCGGKGTTAPPTAPSPSPTLYPVSGQIVDALTGDAIAGVSLRVNEKVIGVSDFHGRFLASVPGASAYRLIATDSRYVTRVTYLRVDAASQIISLIPSTFNVTGFDAALRPGSVGLSRWTSTPALVVLTREVQYANDGDSAVVLERELDEKTLNALVADLRDGFLTLTDGRLGDFTSITLESAAPGDRAVLKREGVIVAARAKDLGPFTNLGGGTWVAFDGRIIRGAVILLDPWADEQSQINYPSHTRKHEMGHAVGFLHVGCCSVMNYLDLTYPEPTDWDRQAARIAYQRPPGNVTPDTDPETTHSAASGRLHWYLVERR